ncbi:MAG TPA: hypothetical protein PK609_02210 [Candidatus Paceibacterota bacterium]|nr:hypothetical protein [Candidatus Paceibacterota bacterium]
MPNLKTFVCIFGLAGVLQCALGTVFLAAVGQTEPSPLLLVGFGTIIIGGLAVWELHSQLRKKNLHDPQAEMIGNRITYAWAIIFSGVAFTAQLLGPLSTAIGFMIGVGLWAIMDWTDSEAPWWAGITSLFLVFIGILAGSLLLRSLPSGYESEKVGMVALIASGVGWGAGQWLLASFHRVSAEA